MIALFACTPEPTPADPPVVEVSPHVPTAVTVTFDGPADATLEVELDGELVRSVPAPHGRASVVGLKAGQTYSFVPVVRGRRRAAVEHEAAPLPEGLLRLAVDVREPDADLARGWFAVALTDLEHSFVAIADGDGDWVWWVDGGPDLTFASPRPTRDGQRLLFFASDRTRDSDDQLAIEVAFDGSTRNDTAIPASHHMVAELDDGTYTWMQWDIREIPWIGGEPAPVLSDRVMVGDQAVFSFFDDHGPAEIPCDHGLGTSERLGQTVHEWTHANSLVWEEETDTIVVGARLIDTVLGLDREGQVRWQLGGPGATIPFADPAEAFSHPHFSEVWADGLLLFDNGPHKSPPVSRVVEYDLSSGLAEVVWTHDEPDGRLVSFLGDARRLPSGGVLVSWAEARAIEELARDGSVRWRAETAPEVYPGRIVYLPALPP